MGPRLKFNIGMSAILAVGLAVTGYLTYEELHRNARNHALQTANLLMAAAEATRSYTTTFIKPHLDSRLDIEFLPQTVPAFAATETINALRKQFPEYAYKEATLNPTNPRDRTSDWEADVVNMFRNDPEQTQIVGERQQGPTKAIYFAKPIKVRAESFLTCHSTAATAPASLIKVYGEANGFGWKLNEIIGAQIVSVPLVSADRAADRSFMLIMSLLGGLAVLALAAGNLLFGRRNVG